MARKKKTVEVDHLLQQGLSLIQLEMNKIEKKQTDQLMDHQAARMLNEYLRTLIALKREGRQSQMEDDLEKMTDEELKEQAKMVMKDLAKSMENDK